MKYRLKIDYRPTVVEVNNKIKKDVIIEVTGCHEVGDIIYCHCKSELNGAEFVISLDCLKFCAEEYYEPQKRKTCPTCKHQKECMERAKKLGIFLLGDFCARYEKATTENIYLSEKDKKEVCWKCRRFNDKSMNICQNYEEGVKCRIWFDDNGNRIDGVGRDCL